MVALQRFPHVALWRAAASTPNSKRRSIMTLQPDLFTLDETIRGQLREASAATVSIQLLKRGFRFSAINDVRPLNPAAARFVGPAYTLRFIPAREDSGGAGQRRPRRQPAARDARCRPGGRRGCRRASRARLALRRR